MLTALAVCGIFLILYVLWVIYCNCTHASRDVMLEAGILHYKDAYKNFKDDAA